ncbi:hypothetical protein GOP47_0002027 [Adiantum capillus-veneris]|uniref:Glycosyltransferase n=1 Tax=Adiantum capillus-veneris TaxID=13818 RepID=A0A9D4ZNT7_ADICA|nr:hypothetical protein GOP47_0002027 [Adiantum capillus-veneris]
MSSSGSAKQQPHALIFPFPAQGHINPMMQLAMRLLDEGFFITFVNTDHNHDRMFPKPAADNVAHFSISPNLRFEHIPDGLPDLHQRLNEQPNGVVETVAATLALPGPLAKLVRHILNSNESPPLTCILADACCTWIQDVADQFHIPRVSLWTTPVHASIAYTFQSTLQSLGIIPVKDQSKLQEVVHCIQGITPMKLEDYISFFLVDSTTDFMFQWFLRLSLKRPLEAAWNLDVRHGNPHNMESTSIRSMWPEDRTCKDWLSEHEKASVIYIAFGSVVNMPEEEVGELIQGLEESGAPFLWAVRPDQCGAALSRLREKLDSEAVQGKPSSQGMLVSWVLQLAVLTHPSVGLFVSHCGWNSVIESVAGGVPILVKTPGFAEQSMNAHYIADVWKIGHRLSNGASASDIKLLISSLVGDSEEAASMQGRLSALRQKALATVCQGGSSMSNFKLFIDDMYRRAAAEAAAAAKQEHL